MSIWTNSIKRSNTDAVRKEDIIKCTYKFSKANMFHCTAAYGKKLEKRYTVYNVYIDFYDERYPKKYIYSRFQVVERIDKTNTKALVEDCLRTAISNNGGYLDGFTENNTSFGLEFGKQTEKILDDVRSKIETYNKMKMGIEE